VHSGVSHHDAVVDADGIEFERDSAGGADGFFYDAAEFLEMDVAGDDVDVRIAHGDERLVEVPRLAHLPGRAQQAPMRRSAEAALHGVGTLGMTG
jgi:hypothetical protein